MVIGPDSTCKTLCLVKLYLDKYLCAANPDPKNICISSPISHAWISELCMSPHTHTILIISRNSNLYDDVFIDQSI